jgi:glycosyltransferase involved in cell wall biosynthesis
VGDAGLLFDPDDVAEMARQIDRLWTDAELRDSLRERGDQRASQYSFDHTARLFRAHYRQLGHRSLTEEDRILLASPPPA